MHVGGVSFQKPVEVHVTVCEPFRENPSLQEKKHREPKLRLLCSTGWEQLTDRDGRRTRMAWHCMAAEQSGYKTKDGAQGFQDSAPTLTLTGGRVLTPEAGAVARYG